MKIMVVGGGGREHAIIKKIKENKEVEKIFALPGNGGIAGTVALYAGGRRGRSDLFLHPKGTAWKERKMLIF